MSLSTDQDNVVADAPAAKRRGNPNWTKKNSDVAKEASVLITKDIQEIPISDDAVWLELYGNILTTYNVSGEAVASAAAKMADYALIEFRKRFPK